MIKFKKIFYKNFLSSGNRGITIDLDKHSTCSITGKNGAGKSTILDALSFALYKKPFRNVNLPQLVNSITNSDTQVDLEFETKGKQYRIVRGLKPNKFEIYENGSLIQQDAASKDYQEYLEENILDGLNEKVFKQVIVIGSANYKPFMQLPAAQRREVVEELLDIKIFSYMLEVTKTKQSLNKQSIQSIESNIAMLEDRISVRENNIKEMFARSKERKDSLLVSIKEEQDKIDQLNISIQKQKTLIDEMSNKIKKYDGISSKIRLFENDKMMIERDIKDFNNRQAFFEKNQTCPQCAQGIQHEHKQTILDDISSKKNNASSKVLTISENINKLLEASKKVNAIQQEIQRLQTKITQDQNACSVSNKSISFMNQEISKLDKDKDTKDIQKELGDLKIQHSSALVDYKDSLEKKKYLDALASMLKDGGIKTKIIKQYIPVINQYINEYLNRFGLPIEFTFDEQFNESIKSRYRDTFGYNNFSEGEKQAIDISMLLTWREIAKQKNTSTSNLLILDETFDSSLDANTTDELLKILLEMDNNSNIFVISHKADLEDKLVATLTFAKQGNFTILK